MATSDLWKPWSSIDEEQEAGLKALLKQCPFIDSDRVGIWGWSGGGSNTLNALSASLTPTMLVSPLFPSRSLTFTTWFQEIFMRTREVNPEGYEKSAPINFAKASKVNC